MTNTARKMIEPIIGMIRILALVFLLVCTCTRLVFADPKSAINYLTNEKVSLFDFGVYQLLESLREDTVFLLSELDRSSIQINFNKTFDRIEFTAHGGLRHDGTNLTLAQARHNCEQSIRGLKNALWIDPDTGAPSDLTKALGGTQSSRLGRYIFTHTGYLSGNEPKNIEQDIDKATIIKVAFFADKHIVRCESSLTEKEIKFSEELRVS